LETLVRSADLGQAAARVALIQTEYTAAEAALKANQMLAGRWLVE
jgi:hypothetical protein